MFCICKCVCNWVGLDKFFDLDLIGVGFRWNWLWWCCPNFYSFIFLATKQRLKRTEKWFCLGLRMGTLEFMIFFFFSSVFNAKFFGFMNLVSGFMNFICWRFHGWLKDEKIWVWVVILYIWVLWFEKFWEDLLLGLCLCSCWRSISVCVWLTRKGKKMQENLSMCSYV